MFPWISSNSCPLNLLLVQIHQAEIIIVKGRIQGRNNVTMVRVEPIEFNQGRRKNDAFILLGTLLTNLKIISWLLMNHTVPFYTVLCLFLGTVFRFCFRFRFCFFLSRPFSREEQFRKMNREYKKKR